MSAPVIVEAIRTPIGKRGGSLSGLHPVQLLGRLQRNILERVGIPSREVGQVIGGCVTQVGEQALNVTRTAWLFEDLAPEVGATTIDCQCGSSQQANHLVHSLIASKVIDVGLACGVESMSRVRLGANVAPELGRPRPAGFPYDMRDQFVSAERLAHRFEITREQADRFAVSSQQKAEVAAREGRWTREIAPIEAHPNTRVSLDEGLRPTTMDAISRLPATLPDGIHTAANTSQISDGAAAVMWMNADKARALGLRPRAEIVAQVVIGCDPYLQLTGPIDATHALLKKSGMGLHSIDLFEINEAFAAVVLAWRRTFDVNDDRLNVNGGAIALGHPMGATGARLIISALHELERTDQELALIAMCCGGAVATGTIIRRL